MKSLSNATIAILCKVLPVLVDKCRKDKDLRVFNAARRASIILRKLRKLNGE